MLRSSAGAKFNGLQAEQRVIEFLSTMGEVRASTDVENKYQDIDIHVRFHGDKFYTPVSIKSNEPENYKKAFLFELTQGWIQADGNDEAYEPGPKEFKYPISEEQSYWVIEKKSWYYKGQAIIYAIWKRDTRTTGDVYFIFKKDLTEFVEKNGFDTVTFTVPSVQKREIGEGKAFTRIGLIDQPTAFEANLAKQVGRIDNER